MTRIRTFFVVAVLLAVAAVAGSTFSARQAVAAHASADPAAVYSCPMHPDYRSDHPGDCPVCGMRLEPSGAPGDGGGEIGTAAAHGGLHISPGRQQAIGVQIGVVTRSGGTTALRTTGRVLPDENRIYPIVAAVSGWIRSVESVATGDVVRENQVLASFLAPEAEFRSAQQSYFTGLEAFYRLAVTQPQSPSPTPALSHASAGGGAIDRMADELRALGVTNSQLREMAARRESAQDIRVESPVTGVVLARNAAPGQRFDRGFEFYRIADLNRVWILADVGRDQLPYLRRGATTQVTAAGGGRAVSATVSSAEPLFDQTTLTLKVRLEASNPQLALKPGMFVDVELTADAPEATVVPADAIVDSGLRKTVFVERAPGTFEPRQVKTGARRGDVVEITDGLAPGERIVVSGTFFVDSESRMKGPARASTLATVHDPVWSHHATGKAGTP